MKLLGGGWLFWDNIRNKYMWMTLMVWTIQNIFIEFHVRCKIIFSNGNETLLRHGYTYPKRKVKKIDIWRLHSITDNNILLHFTSIRSDFYFPWIMVMWILGLWIWFSIGMEFNIFCKCCKNSSRNEFRCHRYNDIFFLLSLPFSFLTSEIDFKRLDFGSSSM